MKEEPFRFHIRLSTGLHRFLRYPKDPVRNHIMTHIVTACLARLQKDYAGDDGDSGVAVVSQPPGVGRLYRAQGTRALERPRFSPGESGDGALPAHPAQR